MPRKAKTKANTVQREIVLHERQMEFNQSNATLRGFVAGVGSGKSVVGAFDLGARAIPGALYAIVSPTFRMLEDATLRTFIEVATKLGLWDETQYRKSDNRAILTNGAEILFRSGDSPNSLRGPTLAGCWLDECQKMDEEVFNIMFGRLRWGGKLGWLSATFTPSGKEHWTYRVFGDKTNPLVAFFKCSTKDNPFVEPAYYESLLLQYGKGPGGILRARQELGGEFVCVEGAEWGPELFEKDIWFEDWPTLTKGQRVLSLDSSKGKDSKPGDYSVFTKLLWWDNTLWCDFDADNIRNASQIAQTAVEIYREWKPHEFSVEEEFGGEVLGDDMVQYAESQKLPFSFRLISTGSINKIIRIRRLTQYLMRKMIKFKVSDASKLIVNQMEVFPHGEHDDGPDSLEMGIRTLIETGAYMEAA